MMDDTAMDLWVACQSLSARGFQKRRTGAGRGRPRPIRSPVLAQNAPDKQHEGEQKFLNDRRRRRELLGVAVAPRNVG